KRLVAAPWYSLVRYAYQWYGAVVGKGAAGRFRERHSAWALMGAVIKAYASAFAGLPRVWRERGKMMRLKRASAAEIDRWFRDYRMSVREIALKD
ncbi:MAG TPA: hypothetical protein VMU02_11240, partial [bacterium]|nr:hypothetical protein [bacterium]